MADEQAQNQGEAVDQIRDLISGQPSGEGTDTGTRESASPAAESPESPTQEGEDAGASELTPTSLAEKLGIKPDELFQTLKIPVEGGDPLTLEEFKKSGKDLRGLTAAQSELAESRVKFENDVMLQRQTLQAAIGKIPPELLTEQMLTEVQTEHREHVETERKALHEVRPDLAEPAKWAATRELLIDHLKPYGFIPIEVDSIIDHRLAKYVIDNAERADRLAKLELEGLKLPKAEKPKAPAAKSPRASKKSAIAAGKRAVSNRDKAAEVAKLLG